MSVAVADNGIGIGIEPGMLNKVFELFTQVQRTGDRAEGGLGVGLALACKLIELHGGAIHASSPGLGQGTRVEMSLPLAKTASKPASVLHEALPAAAAAGPLKVLVVDDNEDAGSTMGLLLEALGHEASVPDIDGYELARRLHGLDGLGKFSLVALTGFGQAADQQDAHATGFDFHCTKPVEIELLNDILARIAAARTQGFIRLRPRS